MISRSPLTNIWGEAIFSANCGIELKCVGYGMLVRVWFRFLREDLAGKFLRYFYESREVLIYDVTFKVSSLTVKNES